MAAAERTEPPRRSGRAAGARRASLADASDNDSFGKGTGFDDTEDEDEKDEDGSEDSDGPRRKKPKRKPVTLDGFPALRAGAGVVVGAVQSSGGGAGAPAAAPIHVVPAAAGGQQPKGYVRQADGLQARFGHVLQAGAPTLHAHELAELRYILTQPPFYSPVKLAELLVRAQKGGCSHCVALRCVLLFSLLLILNMYRRMACVRGRGSARRLRRRAT